jgi:lysophospholipid acyltransferase 5
MKMWETDFIERLGALIGVPEDALRLLMGILLAYPIAIFYIKSPIKCSSANIQHLYFTLTGILVAWWEIDKTCVIHNMICIVVNWVTLKRFGGSKYVVLFSFIFHLTYLNVGYIVNNSFGPAISWTSPHCVLCLRLIGVACDVYDGSKQDDKSEDSDNRKTSQNAESLKKVPSLLEMTSHVFFLPSYFVGPQHSMVKYKKFIQRNIENSDTSGSMWFGVNRCLLGLLYLGMNVVGSMFVPVEYVTTRNFLQSQSFWKQSIYFTLWIKTIFSKYMGVWLLADGSVGLTGLGYNGIDKKNGKILWDGLMNVKPGKYENCSKFMDLVDCFNITTNVWCKNYVYKRCRVLGFKTLSQVITLSFLAIWHGLCSGYFLCFFFELFPITFEKQILRLCDTNAFIKKIRERYLWVQDVFIFLGKMYFLFFLPHCLTPFVLIKYDFYFPVLWYTRFLVVTVFGIWFVIMALFKRLLNSGNIRMAVSRDDVSEKKDN